MKKIVIFDLDGTLLDTIEDITDSMNLALQDVGLETLSIEECKYMVGSGADVLVNKAIKGKDFFKEAKDKYMSYYEKFQKNKTKPYDGVIELINSLKDLNYKIAILSNKPHEDALRVVDYYFGLDMFDLVIGKKANNRIKPDIDGAIEILKSLNSSKEEVIYVGDTNVDMQTANNAGFTAVAVSWGFRKASELENYDFMIENPLQLIEVLGKIK